MLNTNWAWYGDELILFITWHRYFQKVILCCVLSGWYYSIPTVVIHIFSYNISHSICINAWWQQLQTRFTQLLIPKNDVCSFSCHAVVTIVYSVLLYRQPLKYVKEKRLKWQLQRKELERIYNPKVCLCHHSSQCGKENCARAQNMRIVSHWNASALEISKWMSERNRNLVAEQSFMHASMTIVLRWWNCWCN